VPAKNELTSITLPGECGLPKFITVVTARTGTAFVDVRQTRCIAECPQWTGELICKSSFIRTIMPWRTSTVLVENNRGKAVVTVKSLWAHLRVKVKQKECKRYCQIRKHTICCTSRSLFVPHFNSSIVVMTVVLFLNSSSNF